VKKRKPPKLPIWWVCFTCRKVLDANEHGDASCPTCGNLLEFQGPRVVGGRLFTPSEPPKFYSLGPKAKGKKSC